MFKQAKVISRLCLLAIIAVTSCTHQSKWEIVKPEYEVVSSEEQELRLIQDQKLEFYVDSQDLTRSWQRAEIFSEQYLGITPTYVYSISKNKPDSVGLQFSSENFSYIVQKEKHGRAFLLRVQCSPKNSKADPSKAELNAKNLARFIKDGRLQLSLLVK